MKEKKEKIKVLKEQLRQLDLEEKFLRDKIIALGEQRARLEEELRAFDLKRINLDFIENKISKDEFEKINQRALKITDEIKRLESLLEAGNEKMRLLELKRRDCESAISNLRDEMMTQIIESLEAEAKTIRESLDKLFILRSQVPGKTIPLGFWSDYLSRQLFPLSLETTLNNNFDKRAFCKEVLKEYGLSEDELKVLGF